MKSLVFVNLSLLSLVGLLIFTHQAPIDRGAERSFVGSTPCDSVSIPLLKIEANVKCELIKWKLRLFQDARSLAPSTYQLNYTYGLAQQGTNGVAQGGTTVTREGRWSIVRGTQTGTTVYRLDAGSSQESLSFLQLDHNVIHLLDRAGNLAVGHAGWSYTLNRVGQSVPSNSVTPFSLADVKFDSQPTSTLPATAVSAVERTFVGRSPCSEVAAQLKKPVTMDCMKAKWALNLYLDPVALTPTTYKLKGTFYRNQIGEGRWSIVRGTKTDPSAVIYQLDPADRRGSLLLLKADDNILFFLDSERNLMVGNADFSYTLNRQSETH